MPPFRHFATAPTRRRSPLGLLFALLLSWSLPAVSLQAGDTAPPFSLPYLAPDSGSLSLSDLRGKVVYLDFWASWCGPCRLSFPILDAIRQDLQGQGFEVVAVSVDELRSEGLKFKTQLPVSYPLLWDGTGTTPATFGILGMPTAYLIDRKGVIRQVHQGFRKSDGANIRAYVQELLQE